MKKLIIIVQFLFLQINIFSQTAIDTVWAKRIGPTGYRIVGLHLTKDNNNNIIICGSKKQPGISDSSYIVKLSPNGDVLWERSFHYGTSNVCPAINHDDLGNIYAGVTSSSPDNAKLVKFSPDGDVIWIKDLYVISGVTKISPSDIFVDSASFIVAAASSTGTPYPNHFTIMKYNLDGDTIFTKSHHINNSNNCKPRGITQDLNGNIIFAGKNSPPSSPSSKWNTVKCNPQGDLLWVRDTAYGEFGGEAMSVVTDNMNNIIVTGAKGHLLKYSSDGVLIFDKGLISGGVTDTTFGERVLYHNDQLYVIGLCYSQFGGGATPYSFLGKYNCNGDTIWTYNFSYEGAMTMAHDGAFITDSNLIVVATTYDVINDLSVTTLFNFRFSGFDNIADVVSERSIAVYPNPAKDEISIDADLNIKNIIIFNMTGQVVFNENLNTKQIIINTSGFETGMYIVRVETKEGIVTKKFSIINK